MFAMRACRKSTMVGAPLNIKQMTTVSSPALHMSRRSFFLWFTYQLDHSTHGNDGPAVELPTRAANNETFVRYRSNGEKGGEDRRLG